MGDCIYDYSGTKKGKQRPGVHEPIGKNRDLGGVNALLSDHFFYFGNNAITIPDQFSVVVRQGQSHQNQKNESIKHDFVEWLTSSFKPNKLYGHPQVKLEFDKDDIVARTWADTSCAPGVGKC